MERPRRRARQTDSLARAWLHLQQGIGLRGQDAIIWEFPVHAAGQSTSPHRRDFTGDERDINYVLPERYSADVVAPAQQHDAAVGCVARQLLAAITGSFWSPIFSIRTPACPPNNFFINDVYEMHAGVEWRHYGRRATFALRGGAFTDPDHRLRFLSGGNNLEHPADLS